MNNGDIRRYKSIKDASIDLKIPVPSIYYILTHKNKKNKYNIVVFDDNKVDATLISEYARRKNL